MSKELREEILELGARIQPLLDPLPTRKDRIAYAHIFGVIKELCQTSYKEADPRKVRAILKAIEQNPNASLKETYLLAKEYYKELE
jgi:hypothetical protein